MDSLLLRKAKQGDADAFCRLMEEQMQSMYKVARIYLKNEEDSADAIQDTILACYEKLHTLKKDKYFKTWMMRILINKCTDILRKEKRMISMDGIKDVLFEEPGYSTAEWKYLLDGFDEKYRTILLLYYLEGFSVKEISILLDMNESTVKSRLKRGKEQIRKTKCMSGKEVWL